MKKLILSLATIFSFGLYAVLTSTGRNKAAQLPGDGRQNSLGGQPIPAPSVPAGGTHKIFGDDDESDDDLGVGVNPTPGPTHTPAPSAPPAGAGQYKDGSYTGSVADAYYGNVQVKAVISSGKISDVRFLQYPNDRGTSVRINTQAMPILTSEAIQSQSAQVDIVSGATQTSEAFAVSLASALAGAKK